jgi:hypothetical protein
MRDWSSPLVLLLLLAVPCLGQNASVSVSANSGLPNDRRPFGRYLVETCTLAGEQLILTCTKIPYPPKRVEYPNERCPTSVGQVCSTSTQKKDQAVTIKLVCEPASKKPCDPTAPKVGDDFFVSATADSGLPAQQRVLLGNATPLGGAQTVHYHANSIGPIVIRATAQGASCGPGLQACDYAAAPPVDLILQVGAEGASKSDVCPVLPPSGGTQSRPLDAPTIISLVGNPTPFILAAQGPNTIFIYATRLPLRDGELNTLGSFQQAIAYLAGRTASSLGIAVPPAKPFSVELRIPHAAALGDLGTRIGGLNYSQFTLQDVGRNWVRVTAPTQPDCDTWRGFLTDVREMAWQVISAPMSQKLFYLSSSDVATAYSGLTPSSAPTPSSTSTTSPSSSASSSITAPSASPAPSATTTATPSSSAASSGSSSNANITVTQPPGSNIQISSDTTPCVLAGLAFNNATACGSAPAAVATQGQNSSSTYATAVTPTPPGPLAMASVAVAAGTGEQTPPDLLVYSDTNPGDDAQIVERNRIIAQLDLPRPEMILSAWVTQNSTVNPQAMGAFNNMVKGIVAEYNNEYENVIQRGWLSLKRQQRDPNYFNEPFRSYIADRFIANTNKERKTGGTVQELSQAYLDQSQAEMADPVLPLTRSNLGVCERGHYCLGYTGLFKRGLSGLETSDSESPDNPSPIRPTLTDLLLAIIASQEPPSVIVKTVEEVEGAAAPVPPCGECICDSEKWYDAKIECNQADGTCKKDIFQETRIKENEARKRCHAIWHNLDLDHVSPPPQPASCEELNFRGILGSLLSGKNHEPTVHLQCFKKAAVKLLAPAKCNSDDKRCIESEKSILGLDAVTDDAVKAAQPYRENPPYGAGLYRAAIADFLFNYKMSQQYPHEFVPYDLTQSANNLNNALSPLIDAFNRDLWSYQMFVRADMQYQVSELNSRTDERCCVKRLFGLDKPSFFNDGVVTARTISGQPTSVSVTSQSFLNGSTAPELSALLSSLAALGGSGGGGGGASTTTAAGTTTTTTTTTTSGGSGGGSGSSAPPAGGLFGVYGALPALLSNYQTSFAQIGRQLSFTATPRSLATASSAEIAVTLNADESAGGPLYTGPGATDPAFNTSRVANHDTTTRVRVDSIKLFEVSSFSAIVERSRSRFPLLPPFVEIPYIGTFAGIPLGSAKEFHSSTAIVSAYVVPTAADIAYGLHYVADLVVDGLNPGPCNFYKGVGGPDVKNACLFRQMLSLHDVGPEQPIHEFNRNIIRCFATDTSRDRCGYVSFDTSLQSRN